MVSMRKFKNSAEQKKSASLKKRGKLLQSKFEKQLEQGGILLEWEFVGNLKKNV